MDVLLLDIAETLQATEVRLPNGEAIVTIAGSRSDHEVVEISGSEPWIEYDIPDNEDIPQLSETRKPDSIGDVNLAARLPPPGDRGRLSSNMNILARDMDKVHIQ
jgi:hypothetical protein